MDLPTFETMHNHIKLTRCELFLQLGRPQALCSKIVEGRCLVLVAEGAECLDLEGSAGCNFQQAVPDAFGLDHGQI